MPLAEVRRLFGNSLKKITKMKSKRMVCHGLHFIDVKTYTLDEDALKLACQALLEVVQSSSKNIELGFKLLISLYLLYQLFSYYER